MLRKALKYQKQIAKELQRPSLEIFRWLKKHPIDDIGRLHIFKIIEDILKSYNTTSRIVDLGAAEGICSKLLVDCGYDVLAVDIESAFCSCWTVLGIRGVISDCLRNDWWNKQTPFDAIIACVWLTSTEVVDKEKRITNVEQNWNSMLRSGGTVYFDVNTKKYSMKMIKNIFSKNFKIDVMMKTPRNILKCVKY